MTTLSEAKQILYNAFVVGWTTTTPFQFDNENGTNLNGSDPADGEAPWLRIVARNETFEQHTLGPEGGRKFIRNGRLLIQIFVLANEQGSSAADTLSEQLTDIFEGKRFGGVTINTWLIREVGNDGKWYQVIADSTFEYEEIK